VYRSLSKLRFREVGDLFLDDRRNNLKYEKPKDDNNENSVVDEIYESGH
jgi:hypothetical protein